MRRFNKAVAVALTFVMMGSMIQVYPAQAAENVSEQTSREETVVITDAASEAEDADVQISGETEIVIDNVSETDSIDLQSLGSVALASASAVSGASDSSGGVATLASSYSAPGVETHTQDEIIQFIKDGGALLTDEVEYETAYSAVSPYSAGVLTDETLSSAIAMFNNVRYIAGLDADVTLDDDYVSACQAGALIGKVNGTIDHNPTQPSDMDDTFYGLAKKGCREANIAWGFSNLNTAIVKAWMSDDDSSNLEHVGHRAWCLNPTMGKTGFGAVDNYYNMYSFDKTNSSASASNIVWPAQNMPVEYFDYDMPWSIFTGTSETADDITITLTRKSDGRTWTFSSDTVKDTSTTSSSESKLYFSVCDYIQSGTIVFRPDGITSYEDGDEFTVTVDGTKTPLSYTVKFFSLGDDLGHEHTYENKTVSLTPDFDTMAGTASLKCDSCDYVSSGDMTITGINSGEFKCGYTGYISYSFTAVMAGATWSGSNYVYFGGSGVPHKYGEPEFVWDGSTCTVSLTCQRCEETTSEACEVTSEVITDATCESSGTAKYTATYGEYTDTKTAEISAIGHVWSKYTSDNNATCTESGTKTRTCSVCGKSEQIEGDQATGHSFSNYVIKTAATCTTDAVEEAECDNGCGETDTRTVTGSALGHEFDEYVSDGNATCTTDGTETAKCVRADDGCTVIDTRTEEGSATGHSFTNYVPNGDATCEIQGTVTAECDNGCGETHTKNDEDWTHGHDFSNYVSNNDATCTSDGTKTAICSKCGKENTIADEGTKLEHKFTNYVSDDNATCTKSGTKTATCDYGCGNTDSIEDEDVPAIGHDWSDYTYNDDATCTEDGTETRICNREGCGAVENRTREDSATGHAWGEYKSNDDATCQKDGTKTAVCTNEGCTAEDTVTDEGSIRSHKYTEYMTYIEATCVEDGKLIAYCDYDCGEKDIKVDEGSHESGAHSWGDYEHDTDATCTQSGTKKRTCELCGVSETAEDENAPKLGHSYTKYKVKTEATCTTKLVEEAECDNGCGTTTTRTGSALGHRFTDYKTTTAATCTTNAKERAECDNGCGTTDIREKTGTALGHEFKEYVSDGNATCTADGTETAKCVRAEDGCNVTDTRKDAGSATGHSFTAYKLKTGATCTTDAIYEASCDNGCGATDVSEKTGTALGHDWYYSYNDDATCTSDGTQTAKCRRENCDATETVKAEGTKLGHGYEWVTTQKATASANGKKVYKCSACGSVTSTETIAKVKKGVLGYTTCTYDGTAKTPSIKLIDSDGKEIPKSSYTYKYTNNVNVGTAKISITMKGDYSGNVYAGFVINPKATSIKTCSNTSKGVKLTWNKAGDATGYIIYRSVNGGKYVNVKTISNAGTLSYIDKGARSNGLNYAYKVYVYKTTGGKTYISSESAARICYMKAPKWRSVKSLAKKKLTVSYTKNKSATGYQIQYSPSRSFSGRKNVTMKKSSAVRKTITRLSSGRRYYVRVRSYKVVNGKRYYSAWSATKSAVVKK